jgi:hypothetical protein
VASTITQYSSLINVNFPTPGEDNDSQGFRTNFSKIQGALQIAGEEISNLQVSAVSLTDNNDFNDNIIKQATFQDCSVNVYDLSSSVQSGNITIDYRDGSYQKIAVTSGTHVFSFINWPGDDKSGSLILSVAPQSSQDTYINFTAPVVYNAGAENFPIKARGTAREFFEVMSEDDSGNILVKYISGGTTFDTTATFNSPIALATYTTSTLNALTDVQDGSIAFLSAGWHTPVWYNSGTWCAITGTNVTAFWV